MPSGRNFSWVNPYSYPVAFSKIKNKKILNIYELTFNFEDNLQENK